MIEYNLNMKIFQARALRNTKKSCEYFRVPSPRAGGGGQDQHQAYAALWQGGDRQRKAGGLMNSFRILYLFLFCNVTDVVGVLHHPNRAHPSQAVSQQDSEDPEDEGEEAEPDPEDRNCIVLVKSVPICLFRY